MISSGKTLVEEQAVTEQTLPKRLLEIRARGYVVWSRYGPSPELKAKFPEPPIKVGNIRHLRVWGLQVDDERALPGHERTEIPDEDLWQVELLADDGSRYEVNAAFVEPAP